MTQVALLGLGAMGAGMAHNLLKAGFALAVYNRTRAKAEPLGALGARVADTPRGGGGRRDCDRNGRRRRRLARGLAGR